MAVFFKLLLHQHNFILIIAIVAGFCLPSPSVQLQDWIIPLLICAMTLSLTQISIHDIFSPQNITRPLSLSLVLNFIILGGSNIVLGYILTDDLLLRAGFVILAAAPPSLVIPPFSYNLNGDVAFSFRATALGYIASLIILPITVIIFLGSDHNNNQLFIILGQLIILPLVLSQLMRKYNISKYTKAYNSRLINWCIAIVCFILIGLNQELLLNHLDYILIVFSASILTIFGLGEIILIICRKLAIPYPLTISCVLLGSMKKWAGASAIAFVTFGPTAALPAIAALIVGFLYYFWLSIRFKKPQNI